MSQVINTNIASLNAQRNLSFSQASLATSLQRLSSGLRINTAKDDAAGLSISERFTAQIRGMDQARRNANDGVSLAQTAEGALGQMGNLLQRVRELAVQSANGTNSASDRQALNSEVGQLVSELDRFATSTQFNGLNLLDGSFTSVNYQVGANANQTITATSANFRSSAYGTNEELSDLSGGFVASAGVVTQVFQANTLTINGGYGSGTVNVTTSDSAKSIANKINAQTQTGVNASASNRFDLSFNTAGSYNLGVIGSNTSWVNVAFTTTGNDAAGLASAITAFNNVSGQTGITAALNKAGTHITLTSTDGSNITLSSSASDSGGMTGTTTDGSNLKGVGTSTFLWQPNSSGTIGGYITLDSDRSYSTTEAAVAALPLGSNGGVMTGTGGTKASTLQSVSTLDVSTEANATKALRIADSALAVVNGQRATMGALQNRFEMTISNLQTSSENMSAARSRIRDADFAAETASLTRNQVLQQAGVAMLAQANSLPNQVLALLR